MSSSSQSLRVELFGGFRVLVGGREVPDERWRRRQPKTLVKLLALAPGHLLHRDALVEQLWPDAAPDAAANSLNKAIHAARRALEPDLAPGAQSAFLATRDRSVALSAPGGLSVDVAEFLARAREALATGGASGMVAAVDLVRGELLPEDRYEPWLDPYRARVDEARRELVGRLLADRAVKGEWRACVALARELVADDPYDEAARRLLMEAYARAGLAHHAAEQFAELERLLRDELGVEPEPATRELAARIRAGAVAAEPPAASSPAAREDLPPSNLPRRATTFVGRRRDRERVAAALDAARLVTIAGPGGIGKTRLAARVGRDSVERFGGRVWVVELASVDDPPLVARAVGDLFGVRDSSPAAVAGAVARRLGDRDALIVLDNCEHVVAASHEMAGELLDACPSVRLLATSREPLGLEGEVVWRLSPLAVPPGAAVPPAARLCDYDATRLFVDRARLRAPDLAPGDEAAAAIAELCRRLDGVPLAIELAAACVEVLTPEQLVARLDEDPLALPARTPREAPARHRSLRALLDWSYDLLSEPERRLLRCLSVFAGSFALEAAEAVYGAERAASDGSAARPRAARAGTRAGGADAVRAERAVHATGAEPDFLELLASLVEKSLVTAEGEEGSARYRLLDTVRLYAAERLDASPDAEATRRSFATWCAGYAERFLREVSGVNQRLAIERLNAERDNLRAALRWSVARAGAEPGLALRLCGALWQWFQRSRLDEGRAWLERAAEAGDSAPPILLARALHGLGNFQRLQGELAAAKRTAERALALAREAGDREAVARYMQTLASVVQESGDYDGCTMLHREAAAICREVGDPLGGAKSAFALGVQSVYFGEFESARTWFEEALALFRRAGAEGNAMATLHNLGDVALHLGDVEAAEGWVAESLEVSRRLGDQLVAPQSMRLLGEIAAARGDRAGALEWFRRAGEVHRAQGDRPGLVLLLESLARLESADGAAVAALRLLGAATAIRAELALPRHPFERAIYDRCVADAETLLGSEAAREALRTGGATPADAALDAVLA